MEQDSADSQLWHDILTSANQELELSKCKYHVTHFNFQDNGPPKWSTLMNPQPPSEFLGRMDKQ